MSKFRVTWSSGKRAEIEVDEAINDDAYAMSRWGQDSAAVVQQLYGVIIEQVADDEPIVNGNTAAVKADAVNQTKAAVGAKVQAIAEAKAAVVAAG